MLDTIVNFLYPEHIRQDHLYQIEWMLYFSVIVASAIILYSVTIFLLEIIYYARHGHFSPNIVPDC